MNKNRGQPWTTGIGTGAHEGWWRWKAENRVKGKKYRTDGEGRRQGDGIDNREKESEIVQGCEGWVVKAPKVKSNEDLRADSTSADAGKCPCMLFLPIYNVNSILKCCLMESLQLYPSLIEGRVQRLSVSHVWAEFVCFFPPVFSTRSPKTHRRGRPVDPQLFWKVGKVIVFIFLDTLCAFKCAAQPNCYDPHQWFRFRHSKIQHQASHSDPTQHASCQYCHHHRFTFTVLTTKWNRSGVDAPTGPSELDFTGKRPPKLFHFVIKQPCC